MKVSELYKDAQHQTLEDWFEKHCPNEASRLKEQILDADDTLVPRLIELTETELRRCLPNSNGDVVRNFQPENKKRWSVLHRFRCSSLLLYPLSYARLI